MPSRVADAFVDRAPIDWASLLARAQSASERGLIETLRSIDAIRVAASGPSPSTPPARWRPRFAAAVLTVASLQTAIAFAAVAISFLAGEPAAWRPSRLVPAFAFAVVSLLFGAVTRADRRSLWPVATMAAGASAFSRTALADVPIASALAVCFRGVYPEAFAPALLWQFAAEFPRGTRFTLADELARRAAAAAWLLGAALFLVNLAIAYGIPTILPLDPLRRDDPGNLFWHVFAVACFPAIATVLVRARRAPFAERRRVARFAAAVAVGMAPLLVSGLIRFLVPPIDAWFASAGADRLWLDTVVVSTLAAAPILSFAAAVLDRPFVRPLEPRGSPARAARVVLTATLIAPFCALTILLYRLRQMAVAGVAADLRVWLLLALAACGCALFLRRGRLLDWLAGVAPDRDEQLAAAMDHARLARGPREISDAVTRAVRDGMAAGARMLIRGGDGSFTDLCGSGLTLRRDTALLRILQASPVALDVSPDQPAHGLLPRADRDWLTAAGASVMAPLARRDGTLLAVLVAGARPRGARFGRRDRWRLTALMAAAAAAWESAGEIDADEDAALECPACGVVARAGCLPCACAARPAVAALPALVAGKFVVERRVGAGAMGVVYAARDRTLGRAVALKTLPRLRGRNVARLGDEARAMAALSHDALATLYGLELWRGTPVLVVEYLPDGTLARRLASGPLPPAMAIDFGSRLASGLAYMHDRGVLHRDVKPTNIGITAEGLPKLLDFGLAILMRPDEDAGDPASAAGTPAYAAPDALDGATPAPSFDLWALSVVLLEMIAGRNPFAAARPARALAEAKRQVTAACPELTPFFERALARRASDRFPSACALLDALAAVSRR